MNTPRNEAERSTVGFAVKTVGQGLLLAGVAGFAAWVLFAISNNAGVALLVALTVFTITARATGEKHE